MDARTQPRTVAADLYDLLHPRDEADLATPGPNDPRFAALTAWARSQPPAELTAALNDVLAYEDLAQQHLAMGLLRKLGVRCDGSGYGPDFRWRTTGLDRLECGIDPAVKSPRSSTDGAEITG